MPDRYATPAKGSSDWDVPLNSNFSDLDIHVEHRGTTDPATAGISPENGAKFLDTSTGEIYTADGTSWTLKWNLGAIGSGGGSGDATTVEGIDNRRRNVGPLYQGTYHTGSATGNAGGIAFSAQDLHIESTVVDADLSAINKTDLTVELRHYAGGAADPPIVASTTVTLTGGPQRIPLGFNVPPSGSGDVNDEYVLNRAPVASGAEVIPMRRYDTTVTGTPSYSDLTFTDPPIDFLKGTAVMDSGDFGSEAYYYYFYDLLAGLQAERTDSPWSTDVDEMYMRPRDPAEQFDVSPRSIWFDTS